MGRTNGGDGRVCLHPERTTITFDEQSRPRQYALITGLRLSHDSENRNNNAEDL